MKPLEQTFMTEYDTHIYGPEIEQPEFTKIAEPLQAVAEGGEQLRTDVTEKPIESAYALGKGAAAGAVGFGGDIISIVRGIADMVTKPEGMSKLEAFLGGMEKGTGLPTTEDVQSFLNQFMQKPSTEAAETTGELLAPGGYIKAGKSLVKAGKKALAKAPKETRVKYDASGKRVTQ